MSVRGMPLQRDELHAAAAARPMSDGVGPLSAETGLDLAPQRLLRPQPALAAFLAAIPVPDGLELCCCSHLVQPTPADVVDVLLAQLDCPTHDGIEAAHISWIRGAHPRKSR